MSLNAAYNEHVARTTAAGGKPLSMRKFPNMVWAIVREATK